MIFGFVVWCGVLCSPKLDENMKKNCFASMLHACFASMPHARFASMPYALFALMSHPRFTLMPALLYDGPLSLLARAYLSVLSAFKHIQAYSSVFLRI